MTYTPHSSRPASRFRLLTAAAALIACFALPAFAQSTGTGTISGRVFNPATKEFVENAEVHIPGTNKSTITTADGAYLLTDVPAGATKVMVDYTGYTTMSTVVNVAPGQVAKADFDLISSELHEGENASGNESVLKLEAFTVSTAREGNAKAIMEQKESMNVSNIVSSETFGNIAEGNVGEFIKYLPAIQVDNVEADARSPKIRGLPAQYTSVTFNGMKLASADGFIQNNGTDTSGGAGVADRSFGFEQVSLSSIDSVEVNYTTNASQDADAPAGNINLIPKHAYQRNAQEIEFDVSGMMNSEDARLSKTVRPDDTGNHITVPNALLQYSNSFFNHRLGVIVSLNESNSFNEQRQFAPGYDTTPTATDSRPLVLNSISFKDGPKETERSTASFTLDLKATQELSFSLLGTFNHYDAFVGNRTFTVGTTRANVPGDGLNSPWVNVPITSFSTNYAYLRKRTNGDTILPSFEYKTDHFDINGTFNRSISTNNYAGGQSKSWPGITVGGTTISTTGMTVNASHPAGSDYAWQVQQTGGLDWGNLANYQALAVASSTAPAAPTISIDGRYNQNLVYQGKLDIQYKTDWKIPTWFQVGPKVTETTYVYRNSTPWNVYGYTGPGGGAGGTWANYPSNFIFDPGNGATVTSTGGLPLAMQNHNAIGYLFAADPQFFQHFDSAANYQTAFITNSRYVREQIDAGYGMMDIKPITKLELQGGVRYERTREEVKNFTALPTSQVVAAGFPVSASGVATTIQGLQYQYQSHPRAATGKSYNALFPSGSIKYFITPNLLALLGYSYTTTRPSYNDIAGVVTYDDQTNTLSLPNPALKPEYANNYTGRLTYYFEPVGSFGISVFQNDFKNYVQSQPLTGNSDAIAAAAALGYTDLVSASGAPVDIGTTAITTKINLPGTITFRGATVEYSQSLSFLPSPLSGFNVFANYTRLYTLVDVPNPTVNLPSKYNNGWIPGVSPNVINYGVNWQYKRFTIGANARWTDRGSVSTTYWSWRQQNTKIDANASYQLTDHVSLYLYVRNLLDVPDHDFTYFYNNKINTEPKLISGNARGIEYYGAYYYAGIKGTF